MVMELCIPALNAHGMVFTYRSNCLLYLLCEAITEDLNVAVGGIYTVIRSKAYVSTEEMGDQYCLLGPYKEHSARTEVEESDFTGPLHTAVSKMREQGFKATIPSII
jgi:hypothetical protein